MELENAMNKLVDLVVNEYVNTKKELAEERKLNESLSDQNSSLYLSKKKCIKDYDRIRELIAPSVTWNNGKPMYISLFNADAVKEFCELLGIEEHGKAFV